MVTVNSDGGPVRDLDFTKYNIEVMVLFSDLVSTYGTSHLITLDMYTLVWDI